jgi:hypothetical protein
MGLPETPPRSRVPWALALTVGLCSGLAGYVIHAARVNRIPKQYVEVRRLTSLAGTAESPAISPDGKTLAFVAATDGRRQIWVQQVSGGTPQAITKDDTDHYGPRWSADSNNLIYFAGGRIWEIPALGGEVHPSIDAMGPGDLSHDGKLAYFQVREGTAELAVPWGTIVKLSSGMYSNLRWSPDDKKIAYIHEGKVMVADRSGGEPVLASGSETVQGFAWAPDNSGLIVSTRGELWFIPRVERGRPSQLTFGELSYESPDISAGGNLVVSRRSLTSPGTALDRSDIVMFSGLKW